MNILLFVRINLYTCLVYKKVKKKLRNFLIKKHIIDFRYFIANSKSSTCIINRALDQSVQDQFTLWFVLSHKITILAKHAQNQFVYLHQECIKNYENMVMPSLFSL